MSIKRVFTGEAFAEETPAGETPTEGALAKAAGAEEGVFA
jgi:hypothetical protein